MNNLPHLPDPEAIEATPNDLKWIAVLTLGLAESARKVDMGETIEMILDTMATRWRGLYIRAMLEADDLDALVTNQASDEGI